SKTRSTRPTLVTRRVFPGKIDGEEKPMKRLLLTAPLVCLTVVAGLAGDWPVFRGNPAQDGVSPEALPEPLAELWQFKAGKSEDSIDGAPAVVGGVAYVASQDQHVYAVNL